MAAYLVVSLLYVSLSLTRSETVTFKGIEGCSEGYKLSSNVSSMTLVMSSLECIRECNRYDWCNSANVCPINSEQDNLKCEKMADTSDWSCDSLQTEPGCSYFEKVKPSCYNGGTYIESNSSCVCVFGFTGDYCERYYWDCSEAYQKTLVPRGVMTLTIQPQTSPHPFTVSCLLDYGGYTYIETRYGHCPTIDFSRGWEELKYTLGDPACAYWLGLEYIHQLTAQSQYLLDFYISAPSNFGGHSLYTNFKLGDEVSGYRLTYDGHNVHTDPVDDGFAPDGINGPNGHPFSTVDQPDLSGCASSEGVAWWYGSVCPAVNLHLPLYDGSASKHVTWVDGGGTVDVTSFVAQIYTLW